MGRMSKTRKSYRLSQRVKYEDTKPEQVVGMMIAEVDYPPLNHPTIRIQNGYEGTWVITPDFQLAGMPGGAGIYVVKKVVVEVDGPYHDTPIQQRKTEWRDELLVKHGYRIIHVDSELTKNKAYQTYLKDRLAEAILSQEKVVRIDG